MTTIDPRRALPSVERLLAHPRLAPVLAAWSRRAGLAVVRRELERARARAAAGESAPSEEDLAVACAARLDALAAARPRPVVNAAGVVVHTNLGRAPLGPGAAREVLAVATSYSDLEYDLERGERGSRQAHVSEMLDVLFPGHGALVVNNNAAAVLLTLNTLALGREVVVSRGELVEIGGSFRVPEILERSGARLVEVGTTNRTHPRDYERAIGPETALVLKVWPSNYRVVGFTAEVGIEDLVPIARRRDLPVVVDQGCGRLLRDGPGPASEQSVEDLLAAGADVVCFSGDKLLGGPQCGVLIGAPALIARCAGNPLARALRPGKLTFAALRATLREWLRPDPRAGVPTLRMLDAGPDPMRRAARRLAAAIRTRAPACTVRLIDGVSRVGGGAAPEESLPTSLVAITVPGVDDTTLLERLRSGATPVIARAQDGAVLLDPRTLLPGQDRAVAEALARALHG